jgi:hypothetical protein
MKRSNVSAFGATPSSTDAPSLQATTTMAAIAADVADFDVTVFGREHWVLRKWLTLNRIEIIEVKTSSSSSSNDGLFLLDPILNVPARVLKTFPFTSQASVAATAWLISRTLLTINHNVSSRTACHKRKR